MIILSKLIDYPFWGFILMMANFLGSRSAKERRQLTIV